MTQKWATLLQVALPSFYRPRRRAAYNVGPLPTPTFSSQFLTYMCTRCTTPICLSSPGFRSWPKIFTTPHRVDPGVSGEVVDEEHVISASVECSHLTRSPYVGMEYVEEAFAHVSLFWERVSMVLAELARFAYAFNLLLFECWESDHDSF